MRNEQRNDIHRPSAVIPSDYQYVGIWTMNIVGFGDAQFMLREREICRNHMKRTGGEMHNYANGACGICGNVMAIYLVLFYHAKSNEYIVAGIDCAQKLEIGADFAAMKSFKRNLANARENHAGKQKAIALLGDAGLIDAWEVFTAEYPKHAAECKAANHTPDCMLCDGSGKHEKELCTCDFEARWKFFNAYEERTIRDIVGKLVKYGNISDAQKGFIGKLLGNIVRRPIIEAERAAEREAAAPVEAGRHEVSGTVLSMKEVAVQAFGYSRYSGSETTAWKLLIRLDNGAKVWGSRFANLEKGDRIRFTATFEQSKDDAKFGFYKRPVAWMSPEERILQVFQYSWPVQEVTQ